MKILLFSLGILCFISLLVWQSQFLRNDPYLSATMNLEGSALKGSKLFKMNCVGCHGVSGQGLLGPDLHQVSLQFSDKQIINQVRKGLTPPMPSFEMEPELMADLLAYLHSLN